MKRIPLTQGKEALVDDCDFDWLMQWNWNACRNGKTFYARRTEYQGGQHTVLMHVEIARQIAIEAGQIDHRNRNGLDNRRHNLRAANASQNAANQVRYENNTSGITGVYWVKASQEWRVKVGFHNRSIHGGYFPTREAAKRARNDLAKSLHGDYAVLEHSEDTR